MFLKKSFIILLLTSLIFSCGSASNSLRNKRFNKDNNSPKAKERNKPAKKINKYILSTNEDSRKASTFFNDWQGTPYKYGGTTKSGVDCSALVGHFYNDVYRFRLKRQTKDQYRQGKPILKKNLVFGDLVFFKNSRKSAPVDHVGVYIGNGRFFHASTSKGATFSNLSNSYYKNRYVGARRLTNN